MLLNHKAMSKKIYHLTCVHGLCFQSLQSTPQLPVMSQRNCGCRKYLKKWIHFGEELEMYSYRSGFLLHSLHKLEITDSARLRNIRVREKIVLYSDNWMHSGKLISVFPVLAGLLQKQRSLCHCSDQLQNLT